MRTILRLALLFVIACGPTNRGGDNPPPVSHLEVAPPDLSVTVINNAAVIQGYTATLVDPDGNRSDVTSTVQFTLANASFGAWNGASLTVTGGGAGPTRIVATDGTVTGDTGLTVYVKGSRNDGAVPPNADQLFAGATETAGHAPTIAYPGDGILVPPNLGDFDVHWRDNSGNNLFEITLANQYVDLRIYKASAGTAFTTYSPVEWYSLASPRTQLALTVAGLNTASPTTKGTSGAQHVDVTNEIVQGGMYYWTTQPTQGIYRYDMSTPSVPPSSFFMPGQQPTNCIGCHGLSKDGTKMALTLDSGDGRGTIFNVADYSVLVPYASNPQYWNFATFNPDASKLVTVYHGAMSLRTSAGGAILAPIPNSTGYLATHPELSPDGAMLANVETTNDFYDFQVSDGSIVTRPFDSNANSFGAIKTIVANAPGASNYYPSWSPDSQWILFTRTTGNSYSDPSAQIWVVKADGTQPPVQLSLADSTGTLTSSWARWAPFQQSFGATNEPVFYLTFSTTRPFGVRAAGGTQIWMSPFFPNRAAAGHDPSGPAFRMPFQVLTTANHIAQWTEAVVIGRKADGSPLTQAEATPGALH
ncbi:MAG: tolB protein precursor [Myxococcales bacterium]|nr:tolB protein precursor [Myxococcales bacterium]